uniref:Uncharacterized protein n=1 Tax=Anguilla anguilla TaxID=7936 RepID=A0A0E9QWX1_ANGAN
MLRVFRSETGQSKSYSIPATITSRAAQSKKAYCCFFLTKNVNLIFIYIWHVFCITISFFLLSET